MSEADSTSAPLNQVDDEYSFTFSSEIAQKLGEAMKENATTESQASDLGMERNVGKTANPPIATCVGDDRDLFGGYTLKDTLGGGEC